MIKVLIGWMCLCFLMANCASSEDYEAQNNSTEASVEDAEQAYIDDSGAAVSDMSDTAESSWNDTASVDVPEVDLPTSAETSALDQDTAFGEPIDMPDVAPSTRRRTSSLPFKQGMYDFSSNCQMRKEAATTGTASGSIRAGKTLWVEPFNENWLRVYKKSGPVYISRSCLN